VVTKAEHQRLKPFDATHEGWARYIAAAVAVIDTSTGNQADLFQLWKLVPIDGPPAAQLQDSSLSG
jgi:hypothetical protein